MPARRYQYSSTETRLLSLLLTAGLFTFLRITRQGTTEAEAYTLNTLGEETVCGSSEAQIPIGEK